MEEPSKPAVTPGKTYWFIKLDFWCTHYFSLLWVPFWGELVYVGGWYCVSPEKVNHRSPCMKAKVRRKALLLHTVELASCEGRCCQSLWKGRSQGRTCRLSSWSSRRASSRDRSTSCSEARSSPASLATDTRASSRRASFCSLSSLASFKLQGRDCPQTVVLYSRLALGLNWSGPILPRSVSACPHTWLSLH